MAIRATVADRVSQAVVRLPRLGGQGVLVPGGFVLTAAHCIGWTSEGAMVLGDYFTETIVTADDRTLTVAPLFVEPVSDLAVLGAVDGQASAEFGEACDAFEAFCDSTTPVRLAIDNFKLFSPFPAFVFTHNKGIIGGRVERCGVGSRTLAFCSDERVDGGTSGGPVVTGAGRLLGIVSTGPFILSTRAPLSGPIPYIAFALPVWLIRQMVPSATRRKLDAVFPPGRWSAGVLSRLRRRGGETLRRNE